MKHLLFLTFLLSALSVPAAPFAEEWNFAGDTIHGPVKKIVEKSPERIVVSFYDRDGRLTRRDYQMTNNNSVSRFIAYNPDGSISSVSSFRKGELRAAAVERGRYAAGKLVEIRRTGASPLTSSMILLHPSGRVKQLTLQDRKLTIDFGYVVDERGRLTGAYKQVNGKVEESAGYEYDDGGDVVRAERYNAKGESAGVLTNTYRRDRHGNWTERVLSFGARDQPPRETERITREIEYY